MKLGLSKDADQCSQVLVGELLRAFDESDDAGR